MRLGAGVVVCFKSQDPWVHRSPWAHYWLAGLLLLGVLLGAFSLHAEEISSVIDEDIYVQRGAALVKARACRACHLIGGEGAMVGPALDQVMLRRPKDWLRKWLSDPAAMKPGTLMVEFDWSEEEFRAIFAYLAQFQTPVDGAAILAHEKNTARAGEMLIEAYQCGACHKVTDQSGRPIYPELTTVKDRRTPEWEKQWLKDPQLVKPGTFMPTFGFSAEEINAIVDYLYQ